MNRIEAIKTILARHPGAAFFFSNGLTSREACAAADRPGNFYMLHGMGETLAVAIGFHQACPEIETVAVEGDGNAIMGLASVSLLPREGLYYYVLDNGIYETTGGQVRPELNFEIPFAERIPIEEGVAGTPNPPDPEKIKESFLTWRRQACVADED